MLVVGCLTVFWTTFGFLVLFGLLVASSDQLRNWDNELEDSHRSIKASHLHLLGECRRHWTFLASVALGAFITRVMKDSPLTPLPLPPLREEDRLRWNLVSIPAHLPFYQWMTRHPDGQTVNLNQGFAGLVEPSNLFRSLDNFHSLSGKWKEELIRRFAKMGTYQDTINTAVQRTLKPLKHILPHAIGIRRWLLRLCP